MTDRAAPTTVDYPILVDGYGRQFVKVPVEEFVKLEAPARSTPAEGLAAPQAALRIEYETGRRHGYEEGHRAALAEARSTPAEELDVERLRKIAESSNDPITRVQIRQWLSPHNRETDHE